MSLKNKSVEACTKHANSSKWWWSSIIWIRTVVLQNGDGSAYYEFIQWVLNIRNGINRDMKESIIVIPPKLLLEKKSMEGYVYRWLSKVIDHAL